MVEARDSILSLHEVSLLVRYSYVQTFQHRLMEVEQQIEEVEDLVAGKVLLGV